MPFSVASWYLTGYSVNVLSEDDRTFFSIAYEVFNSNSDVKLKEKSVINSSLPVSFQLFMIYSIYAAFFSDVSFVASIIP